MQTLFAELPTQLAPRRADGVLIVADHRHPDGTGFQRGEINGWADTIIPLSAEQCERIEAICDEAATQPLWETLARAEGWTVVANDPDPTSKAPVTPTGPCLYHADLDRVWTLGDWEGACRDIGLDETDMPDRPLSARETATILAALRMWQAEAVGVRDELPYDDIATDNFTLEALTSAEIDALCERLNQ